ncbi:hypothetical protein GCM10009530_02960 [Microbispora corallina]|uniref:Uncharacterized protein n=1 Tax=Microbispora corallina TaxID=83302 RepID=A0ABQ4FRM3_9ACTN|nr:hypothetical protein Mco01_04770 [Microbispora corallina]
MGTPHPGGGAGTTIRPGPDAAQEVGTVLSDARRAAKSGVNPALSRNCGSPGPPPWGRARSPALRADVVTLEEKGDPSQSAGPPIFPAPQEEHS